jgi:hypothetical protein
VGVCVERIFSVESYRDLTILPAERIARLCGGTLRNGRGEFLCPVHGGHCLNIKDGRDHRALVWCWGGCSLTSILTRLGLTKRDLFVQGPPLTAEQREEIARRERQRRDWVEAQRLAARRVRDFTRIHEELGSQLAKLPEADRREREMVRLYHAVLDRLRHHEAELQRLERAATK